GEVVGNRESVAGAGKPPETKVAADAAQEARFLRGFGVCHAFISCTSLTALGPGFRTYRGHLGQPENGDGSVSPGQTICPDRVASLDGPVEQVRSGGQLLDAPRPGRIFLDGTSPGAVG